MSPYQESKQAADFAGHHASREPTRGRGSAVPRREHGIEIGVRLRPPKFSLADKPETPESSDDVVGDDVVADV